MKPSSSSADATLSFADFKPTPAKGGPDATVSLAETPARVQLPSARPQPVSARTRPAAAPQGKTLFGLPAVLTPPAQAKTTAAASHSAVSKASALASLPAVAPRVSTRMVEASTSAPEQKAAAGVAPSALNQDTDRTLDVSLSETALVDTHGREASAEPASASQESHVPSMMVSEDASLPAREEKLEQAPVLAPPLNAPSTEPAPPPPRSALKYGIWAAVPVGLCAAWFAWHSPLVDTGATHATESALKSEQKLQEPERSLPPAALAPAAEPAVHAPVAEATPGGAGAVAAAEAPEAPAPQEDTVSPSVAAPEAEPSAPTAPAEAAAELDPDAEEAEVELDASRKVVAARAEKLVSEGHALRKKKKLAPARAKYRDALVIYPGYPRAIAGLVQVSIQQRDGKAAVNLAKQLVKLRPAQVSYQVLLGDAYKAAGKPGLAKETWQGAARKGSATAKARLGE